jgi:hypothetical protein
MKTGRTSNWADAVVGTPVTTEPIASRRFHSSCEKDWARGTSSLFLAPVALAAVLLCAGCQRSSPAPLPYSFEAQPSTTIEDSMQAQVAATTADMLYVLTSETQGNGTSLRLRMSRNGGDTFDAPVTVSPANASISGGGENGPSLYAKGMNVYALWQQRTGDDPAAIALGRSANMGASFEPPTIVSDKPASDASFSGFAALGVAPNGDVYAAWLDGRDSALNPPGTFSVYLARSRDRGKTFEKNVRVATQACPCCRPSLAFGGDGQVVVSYRRVSEEGERDIAVAASADGQSFGEPVRVGDDHWKIQACPEAGASMAYSRGVLYVAWFSAAGTPGVRLAYSEDNGRTFSAPILASAGLDDGNHPLLAAGEDGSLSLVFQARARASNGTWSSLQPFVARVEEGGKVSQAVAVPAENESGSRPHAAVGSGGRIFVAWSNSGKGAVEISRGRILP